MNIGQRLARLERTAPAVGPRTCDACGNPLPISVRPAHERLVINPPRIIGEPPGPEDDPSKDCCASCGRRLVLRIKPPRLLQPYGAQP